MGSTISGRSYFVSPVKSKTWSNLSNPLSSGTRKASSTLATRVWRFEPARG